MKYDLVFEGGGAKGIAFVGAIEAFLEPHGGPERSFGRLMGSSAGAIAATLLAAGYTPGEVKVALAETRDDQPIFVTFLGDPPPLTDEELERSALRGLLRQVNLRLVPDSLEERLDTTLVQAINRLPGTSTLLSFAERGGLYSAHDFIEWLKGKLDSGTHRGAPRAFSHMNLAEFYEATGIDLTLIAADISASEMLILNHMTAPDCPVVMAVRMSMSFPLLWNEVVWQEEWGLYRERDIAGHAIVDGGLLSNFPIELFISDLPHVTAVMGPQQSDKVLGFLIDENLPVDGAPPAADQGHKPSLLQVRTVDRLRQLINTVTQAHDKMVIKAFSDLVVHLPAAGFGTIEFAMTEQRRDALIAAARQATARHLTAPAAMVPGAGAKGVFEEDPQSIADDIALRLLEPKQQ